MEWVYVVGLVLLGIVFVVLHSFDGGDTPRNDDGTPGDYQWGDELHEYSYRHPWEDEL